MPLIKEEHDLLTTQSPFRSLTIAQRKNSLVAISWISLSVGVLLGLIYAILYVQQPAWQLAISALQAIPTALIGLLAIRLARTGREQWGTYILLIYLLAVTALISVILGLLPAIGPVYMVFILMAGLMFGTAGGYIIATIASILWLVSYLLVGLGLPESSPLTGISPALVLAILTEVSFFTTAYMTQAATGRLWDALNDAAYELITANRRLETANQQKSRFLARMSHDLRTPLTAIILNSDLVLRQLYGELNDKQTEVLKRVPTSAQQLQTLINDILDISKIEAGQLNLTVEQLSVESLVDTVTNTMELKAQGKKLAMNCSVAPDFPPVIEGDQTRLTQILTNLTDNAIKFTEQGEVKVRLERKDQDFWRIIVSDTGRGIAEADLSKIFDEFEQIKRYDDSVKDGSGLGLAITRHLVQLMKGNIQVKSQIGKGSTFVVELPIRAGL